MIGRYIDLGNPVADHPLVPRTNWWLPLPNNYGGSKIFDITRKANHGTLTSGAVWGPGPPLAPANGVGCTGGASFDVSMPAIISSQEYWLAVHAFPKTYPGGFTTIFDDTSRQWSLFLNGTGDASFAGSITSFVTSAAQLDMVIGSWWQFTITRKGTTTAWYVNGKQIGTHASDVQTASAATLKFGANPSGGGQTWDGKYGDVMFDDTRGLSDVEVANLYGQTRRGYPDMLRRFSRRVYSFGTVAAGGSTVPRKQHSYRRRRVA